MKDFWILILIFISLLFLPDWILRVKLLLLCPKLQRFCKKRGYDITWHRHPLSHSKTSGGTLLCSIDAKTKKYEVALMSSKYRLREYFFISKSELGIYRSVGGIWVRSRAKFLKGITPARFISFGTTYQTVDLKLDETIPENAERILLFYPIAKDVTWNAPGRGKQYLGNGDLLFCKYRLLSLSAFLEELASPGKYLRRVNPWEEY